MKIKFPFVLSFLSIVAATGCADTETVKSNKSNHSDSILVVQQDDQSETISVLRDGQKQPILVQNAKAGFRPYIHPIIAPDSKGTLTENSPTHHPHQSGLYWAFTRVNGRDYFHNPGSAFWKKVSAFIVEDKGREVKWQTVYDLLDDKGTAVLTETQNWSMRTDSGRYILSLQWQGVAKTEVTIGKYDYGGMFLRMPWKEGMEAEVINQARQRNEKAEGQRAMWVDVGMKVEGRDDAAHIAILDHPENPGYPQHWRVDNQAGIGPVPSKEKDINIKNGETLQFRHQLIIYTGELDDRQLGSSWSAFTGDHSVYTEAEMWRIAQQEGREAKFLKPDEAVQAMTIKNGYTVSAWASEPLMTQPMAFCWDDRGRMWIAENRDYESRGQGFSNSGDSRILILEDTNHDGKADTRKVFMEGIAFPAAIATGFDGVFIGAPPNLLFVPDRNHDDKADIKDIEIRLTGWGISDRHETLNSFHWGPDGWLYGCQGFATPSKVRKPKGKGKLYKHRDPFPEDILQGEGTDINGGVWRYHPTKDKFEVVAHGFSNPWGIDYDAKGQLFISACVIPHMWHVIPGGIYHRQGGQHFNPYVYDDIKTITNHSHRSAHGGARIYQSDAFGEDQRGRIFMANIHEHAVLTDILTRKGSGFEAGHGDDFMMANNAQWVGFSIEIGPDGNVYVLDWHDADICGQDVLNSETGRIFRIAPEKSNAINWPKRFEDLSKFTDAELVDLQTGRSDWHARRARVILQSRAAKGKLSPGTHARLKDIYKGGSVTDTRLKAMWALYVTNGLNETELTAALNDTDEYIRAWAIQLLCEDLAPSQQASDKLIVMSRDDASPVVRLYLASAMQRIDKIAAWKIAEGLIKHKEDVGDHNLPKMIWFGFEGLVKDDPARALKIAGTSGIPLIAQYTARRAVDAGAMNELVAAVDAQPATLTSLMEGMINGMEGRVDLEAPASWKNVYAKLKKGPGKVPQLADEISGLLGDTEVAQRSLAVLDNSKAPIEERKKALSALSAQQQKALISRLPVLFAQPELRREVIRAIAAFDDRKLGEMILKNYSNLNAAEKSEAIQTLSSRPTYGRLLTNALKNKSIAKNEITPNNARQMRRVVGSGFVEVWGPIDDKPRDNKEFDKYNKLLNGNAVTSADMNNGREVFMKTCGACHTMFGKGGNIGPDLTGSNRSNLDYLLFNILTPSAEIQDAYKMMVVTTRDGRTYTGNLVAENQRQITIRVVGSNDVVLNKSTIQSREVTDVSLMPQGLLNTLSEKEVKDLMTYLRRAEQ